MKKFAGVLVCICVILLMCACGNNADTSDSAGSAGSAGEKIDNAVTKETLDIENLKENEFRISDLPGKITVPQNYNVYSADNEYTAEMCAKQGVSPDKMKMYIDTQKEYGGINMIIVPSESPIVSPDFEIQIKVNSEKDYKLENLKDISEGDFNRYKDSLMGGFETSLNTELTSQVYENEATKWIVFDCFMVNDQTRYATILNGKMVYVIGRSNNGPLTKEQKTEVTKILDTLEF